MDDVRLIDANKLLKKCIEGDGNGKFTEGYNFAVQEISAYIALAPTIEAQPVKRGHWVELPKALNLLQKKPLRSVPTGSTNIGGILSE